VGDATVQESFGMEWGYGRISLLPAYRSNSGDSGIGGN
jgi:hypothetical protein